MGVRYLGGVNFLFTLKQMFVLGLGGGGVPLREGEGSTPEEGMRGHFSLKDMNFEGSR